jgi:hypothetical protein
VYAFICHQLPVAHKHPDFLGLAGGIPAISSTQHTSYRVLSAAGPAKMSFAWLEYTAENELAHAMFADVNLALPERKKLLDVAPGS